MTHEITITLYNPTMNKDGWTADVYLKSFDRKVQTRRNRIYCGSATVVDEARVQTKAEALAEAYEFLSGFEIPE